MGAYTVERDDDQICKACGRGRYWDVIGPDGVALGVSFSSQDEADDLAENMSIAYTAGQKAAHAATAPSWEAMGVAFRMIRDAVEELGPVGAVKSREVGPPDPVADAEAIVDGIMRIADENGATEPSPEAPYHPLDPS